MDEYGIRCGLLVDGTGRPPTKNATVIVTGERISRVVFKGDAVDPLMPLVDAQDCTVIPGLIDAHKHVMNCGGSGIGVGLDLKQMKTNIAEITKGGVTSVLDLGAANVVPLLERAIGPKSRIFNAISILTCTGGYPSEYMPKSFYRLGAVVECGSRFEIEKAVKSLARRGVAAIKTAVVTRTFDGRAQVNWTDKDLCYLTDAAHGYGLNVCAHITYVQDYDQAIRCGVDSAHHAAFDGHMGARLLSSMIERGMIFVPTLSLADLTIQGLREQWIYKKGYRPAINDTIRKNMEAFTDSYLNGPADAPVGDFFVKVPKKDLEKVPYYQQENVRRYIELGGEVAMGTDSALGFSLHNTPVREVQLFQELGLSLEKAIEASTRTSAKVFGREHDLGSIEAKKLADIVIVDADLSQDIAKIDRVKTVIVGGRTVYESKDA